MGKRGRPDPSDAVRARCIVEASLPGSSDGKIATKYGVDVRSIRRWRAELEDRPELAAMVRALREEGARAWAGDMRRALNAMLARQLELLPKLKGEDFSALSNASAKLADVIAQHEILAKSEAPREPADREDPPPPAAGEVPPQR